MKFTRKKEVRMSIEEKIDQAITTLKEGVDKGISSKNIAVISLISSNYICTSCCFSLLCFFP